MNRSGVIARSLALLIASSLTLIVAGCVGSIGSGQSQATQTISFATVGAQTVGATVTLSASASSGLPVAFTSNTPAVCTVSGSTATMIASGTCTLEATQAGNSKYLPANAEQTVSVSLPAQTITFANPGAQAVGTPLALTATASSGLTVSFTSQTTNVCTVSGTTVTLLKVGTCTIQATQAGNATYAAATPVSQSFAVNAAALLPQTITFNSPGTQTVGTPLTLSATASSGLTVSFASQTTSVCTVSGTTVTFLKAGTCTIQATQAGNATYAAATPVSQSFTVNAGSLQSQTITFNNPGTQTVGTPLTLSATASSGLNVSFASQTTSVCTVSGTTATFLKPGTCTIQATQVGNATYAAATPVSQSFTVNAATGGPVTITTTTCPGGTQGQAYAGCALVASGGTPPYTFSYDTTGNYPPPPEGISLDPNTGDLTSSQIGGEGAYSPDFIVKDSKGATATQQISFAINGSNAFASSIFPADSIFHHRVDAATTGLPVDTSPAAPIYSAYLPGHIRVFFGNSSNPPFPNGIPMFEVPGNQPDVSVSTTVYQSYFISGPIPANAPVEGTSLNGGDRHVLIYREAGGGNPPALYEMWQGIYQGGPWTDSSNALWPDVTTDALTPQGNGTSDAAGLPVAPLVVNADEVIGAGTPATPNGTVQHPIRFTLNHMLNYWVWPATETAGVGSCSDSTGSTISTGQLISQSTPPSSCSMTGPAGEIYRLKASTPTPSCAATSPQAAIIITAFRNYGIILADNGMSGGLIGTPDARWNDDDLSCLMNIQLSDFEPVNVSSLMVNNDSGQTASSGTTSQTITFANPGAQTVGTPLVLVATATSGLPVSFNSQTTNVCTVNGTTATFSVAGTCTIQATQPGNTTYAAATPVTQSFTVNAAVGPSGNSVGYSTCPAPAGTGTQYAIGMLNGSGSPSGPQTIAAFTNWNNLNPGDVVCIYGKSTPYAERLVLTRGGTDDQHRVRIVGVNQGGFDPILTGESATTASAFNYGVNLSQYYEGGEVSVTGLNYGTPVAYLNIEGLTIEGATTAEVGGTVASPAYSVNTYSDPNINGGAQSAWGCGAAGINLIRSDHVSIIHNRIRDNDNGIFVNSNNGNTSSNVLIESNHIYGNGVFGEQQGAWNPGQCHFDAHGTYTEAENITYLGNRFGALRQGEATNLLKDRSSGLVVAYNFFEPDGSLERSLSSSDALLVGAMPGGEGHLLDLVESYDTSVGPPGGLAALGAVYQNVSVYGNIFFDDGAASDGSQGTEDPVHFGGDQGNSAMYRKFLHFYNNTVVARRGATVGWLEMEPTTTAGVWNNILYAAYTGSSTAPAFDLVNTWCYDKQYGGICGTANYQSQNWNSPIWGVTGVNGASNTNPNFVNLANYDVHIATSDPTIVGNGQAGDPAYPANATTIPIEYEDFLTTVTRPYSAANIDLGALGYSGTSLLSQTITFNNPGAQTVGTPLNLSATASSGLTVSFASQTKSVCTVSGTTATFLIAGSCTIQATQAGNATYAAATPVSQSFTVNASSSSDPTSGVLPSYNDAYPNWKNAGLALIGGIPDRTTICATVNPLGGGQDDFTDIQTAIDNCPVGEVVQLGAGAFNVKLNDLPIQISTGITLRGTGTCSGTNSPYCQTSITVIDGILAYTGGQCGTSTASETACPNGGPPEVLIAPVTPDYNYSWEQCGNAGFNLGTGCGAVTLTADAAQGDTTIHVSSTTGVSVGQWVLIDEASGAGWVTDPMNQWTGYGSVWAASDWLSSSGSPATGRVVWSKAQNNNWDFGSGEFPYQKSSTGCWFSYCDRPTAELHKVASIGSGTITFDDPLTVAFRQSNGHNAQVYRTLYGDNSNFTTPISFLQQAGVENLSLLRSPNGGMEMEFCANCWIKNTEVGDWYGGGISVEYSARSELNTVYIHHCWNSVNSGGEYPLNLSNAATEILVTNSIINFAGKGMVARAGGAGSVISYNYVDDTMYDEDSGIGDYWVDTGINASHYSGPHHVLFEGNWGDNLDNDNTHGNSMYMTFFRNQGSGLRTPFTDPSIPGLVDDFAGKAYYCPNGLGSCVANGPGPFRAAGPMSYNYWFAFVGNALGLAGETTAANGWTYTGDWNSPRIFMLGWNGGNGGQDPYLDGTSGSYIFINGNYDYVQNKVTWQGSPVALPNSFYLSGEPSFFSAGSGYTWPWVTPTSSSPVQSGPSGCGGTCSGLPAQARWQAGTPFVQP